MSESGLKIQDPSSMFMFRLKVKDQGTHQHTGGTAEGKFEYSAVLSFALFSNGNTHTPTDLFFALKLVLWGGKDYGERPC